ncbi:MAG: pitrilysin family protein [Patescibacteria group bacterium]
MYQKLKLKNGLPVILVPKKESQSVAVYLIYKVGSRNEKDKAIHGASHFIEHLMFKGTKKRPSTLAISKELDGIGADFNAYTSKDHTAYHIKANSDNLDLACDILADMLNNSLFPAKEIAKEKGVVIEEIKMYEDQPIQYAEILCEELLFKGSDLEHNIAGTRESISKMTRQQIVNYLNSYYAPANAVLMVVGKYPKNIENVLNKYFVQPGFGKKFTDAELMPVKLKQIEPQILLNYKATNQAHLAMAFPAYSYFHPDLYALYLLAIILGGNMSSRLFIDVREKQGLCYYIRSQADIYEDSGDLMIRSGIDISKLDKALAIIFKDLRAIKAKGITAEELAKAKTFLKGRLTLQLEELNDLADFYGREFILAKRILTPEQKIKKIMAVTKSQVNKVAKDIIQKNKLNLVLVSPLKDKKKILKHVKI